MQRIYAGKQLYRRAGSADGGKIMGNFRWGTVEPYFEPIDIFDKIGERKSELSDESLGFICGLIKKNKPQKIVEVGVSAGGTTCVIMNCLEKLNMNSSVYSVDLAYTYHYDTSKKCGYQIDDAAKYLHNMDQHKLILGKTIAETIEDIAAEGKVDLLILDTIHYLPGELLDFIVCLPYLSDNAVVIADDLIHAHYGENNWAIATKVLFDTVVADKYLPDMDEVNNMCAFQLNSDSRKYTDDLFFALLTPWWYGVDEEMLVSYQKIINTEYSENENRLFNEALRVNAETLKKRENIPKAIRNIEAEFSGGGKKVLLYGAGTRGTALHSFLSDRGYEIAGFVISDDRDKKEFESLKTPVFHLSEIKNHMDVYKIIVAVADEDVTELLDKQRIPYAEAPNYIFPFIKDYAKILIESRK
jgi:predicted O-methyltransferase YrrM